MIMTSKKESGTISGQSTGQTTTKSGKGLNYGVISELASFWTVKPGHEEELRAAVRRFAERLSNAPPEETQKTGLRDSRHVIFDDGRRMLWATTFETDWDPYVDDALLLVGLENFLDWMQHTVEGEKVLAWMESAGGLKKFDKNDPAVKETTKRAGAQLKAIIQSVQTPAAAYFNAVGSLTNPQITKAQRLEQAFQKVLDDPAAEEALQHPGLKPLLEQAAY
jgi:hypothetical protein